MRVKHLSLKNFKNIEQFDKSFDGGVYLVTGSNEIGKTTLINAIVSLLTGERSSNLLQTGKENGYAKMVVGNDGKEYNIEVRMTENNPKGSLTITDQEGMKSNTITGLQKLFGYTNFDAYDFVAMSKTAEGRRSQVEYVKQLLTNEAKTRIVEIDSSLADLDVSRKTKNILLRNMVERLKGVPEDAKDYGEMVEVELFYKKKEEAKESNSDIEKGEEKVRLATQRLNSYDAEIVQIKEENTKSVQSKMKQIENLREQIRLIEEEVLEEEQKLSEGISEIETNRIKGQKIVTDGTKWLSEQVAINIDGIDSEIQEGIEHNKKHALYSEVSKLEETKTKTEQEHDKIKSDIKTLLTEKETIIKNSDLPIDGLSFTDEGLFLNDIQFKHGEVSTSQEMEVAVKLMIALNPKVKVFRIAQGESLDERKLKSIVDFANENKLQGFIEQVQRNQDDLIVEKYQEDDNS
jgi:DNA repair exonuclease SbcCD ATPase subunit